MDYRKQFYNLSQFMGGYFHQDWKDEYDWKGQTPSFEPVVHFYKAKNPPAIIAKTIEEMQRFLALQLNDEELKEVLQLNFHVSYNPQPRGLTKRQWLEEVLKILKDANPAPMLRER